MKTFIKVQNLLLPRPGICRETALFYRPSQDDCPRLEPDTQRLVFSCRGGACDFSAYFNTFSFAKWQKYTTADCVRLCLLLKGDFQVRLLAYAQPRAEEVGDFSAAVLDTRSVSGDGETPVCLACEPDPSCALLGFSLTALSENAVFCGGWYEAEVETGDLRDVDLAVNICTFKREPFLLRNLATLDREILSNPDSELCGHLQVFVSDNGRTLPWDQLSGEKVHVVPNKNLGGVGGFTRGLLEILGQSSFPATHVIMMDDDIVIETEALFRTYSFLRCRRAEYEDLFVGGAMLRLDRPRIQHESGGLWNVGRIHPLKQDLDLGILKNCVCNEEEEDAEYNAWWYCCIPMQFVREDNLPCPYFIHCDDAEYGIRNTRALALLNGICVWHEPFDTKYSSFLSYYDLRNMLYTNVLHYPEYGSAAFLKVLFHHVTAELFRYRYLDAKLQLRAVRDFCEGSAFLLHTDGEQLHKEIMAAGYKAVPAEELPCPADAADYARSLTETESAAHKLLRRLSFNGYLLPARRGTVRCVPMAKPRPLNCFRSRAVLNYDPIGGKGFLTRKSYRQLISCLGQLLAATFLVLFRFEAVKKDLRSSARTLRSAAFWRAYLDL